VETAVAFLSDAALRKLSTARKLRFLKVNV
jgi:hypothetical protein